MITEWFASLGLDMFGLIVGFLPQMTDAEGVVVTATNGLTSVIAGVSSLGVWIPWGVIAACVSISFGTYVSLAFLKLVRVVAAHIPFVGGAG